MSNWKDLIGLEDVPPEAKWYLDTSGAYHVRIKNKLSVDREENVFYVLLSNRILKRSGWNEEIFFIGLKTHCFHETVAPEGGKRKEFVHGM